MSNIVTTGINEHITTKFEESVKILSLSGVLSILVAVGIIFIGIREFLYPGIGALGFGVPLLDPRDGDLLAIKAVRDVVSGVLVFHCWVFAIARRWPARLAY